jgi:hypothetical protein
MDDMDWTELIIQLLVTMALVAGTYFLGLAIGRQQGYDKRIEDMRENAQQVASKAKADLDVLNAVSPPRQRQVRIKGTSRRNMGD